MLQLFVWIKNNCYATLSQQAAGGNFIFTEQIRVVPIFSTLSKKENKGMLQVSNYFQ